MKIENAVAMAACCFFFSGCANLQNTQTKTVVEKKTVYEKPADKQLVYKGRKVLSGAIAPYEDDNGALNGMKKVWFIAKEGGFNKDVAYEDLYDSQKPTIESSPEIEALKQIAKDN